MQVNQGESNVNHFDRMTEINRNSWRTPNSEKKKIKAKLFSHKLFSIAYRQRANHRISSDKYKFWKEFFVKIQAEDTAWESSTCHVG